MIKIAVIGSTLYRDKMERLQAKYNNDGIECRLPRFDDHSGDELSICQHNRQMVEWADEIHVFWDQRSMGTVFDFGMVFALRKKIVIEYLEEKTIGNVMRKYESVSARMSETVKCPICSTQPESANVRLKTLLSDVWKFAQPCSDLGKDDPMEKFEEYKRLQMRIKQEGIL